MRTLLILLLTVSCFGQGLTLRSPLRDIARAPVISGDGVTNGIIAWWKLDDASGTSAVDSSGFGDTLTLEGNATWGTGRINGCTTLDGTGDDLYRASSSIFSSETDGTICGWFKTSNSGAVVQDIVASSDEALNGFYLLVFVYSGTLYYTTGAMQVHATTTTGLADGNWHHFAVTSNGSTIAMYVDGTSQSLTVDNGSNTGQWFDDVIDRDNIMLGGDKQMSGYTDFFTGSIDDIKIFDRVLSGGEITSEAAR